MWRIHSLTSFSLENTHCLSLHTKIKKERALKEGFQNYEESLVRYQTAIEVGTSKQWWEISRDSLEVGNQLGSGAFGEVKKGVLTKGEETITCAIKMLKRKYLQTPGKGGKDTHPKLV